MYKMELTEIGNFRSFAANRNGNGKNFRLFAPNENRKWKFVFLGR
jgi:hypothetical protein